MRLRILPDPAEPAGGYAFLVLPGGTLTDASVTVAVFDAFSERWLAPAEAEGEPVDIGNGNWQSERFGFGPYPVDRSAADDADRVRIGPEIVNKLEEYAPLQFRIGPVVADAHWPDDVRPRAGAAVLGGIRTGGRDQPTPVARTMQVLPDPEPEPKAEPEPDPQEPLVEDPAPADARSGRRSWMLFLLVLALVIGLGLLWIYWLDDLWRTMTQDDPTSVEETAEVTRDQCDPEQLAAMPGGFMQVEQAIRDCGDRLSADAVLHILEDAADREDPAALYLFGRIYDGADLDSRIEHDIGLTLGDDPGKAVEYYARAVQAGSKPAAPRLKTACNQLSGATATLARGAYDDYCR